MSPIETCKLKFIRREYAVVVTNNQALIIGGHDQSETCLFKETEVVTLAHGHLSVKVDERLSLKEGRT